MTYFVPYGVVFRQGISGLQNCLQLQKLYLYDNEICEMTNLELQVNLEVLWLNNNSITIIKVWTLNYVFAYTVSIFLSF